MSRGRTSEVATTSDSTSVIRRAATTAASGSRPAEEFTSRTADVIAACSAAGLSPGSGSCGATTSGAAGSLRNHATAVPPRRPYPAVPGSRSGSRVRLPGSAAGELVATGALQIGLGALDLAFQRLDRLRHRVDRLDPERVDGVHGGEHVVERRLQLLDLDGRGGRLLVDRRALDAQLLRGRLDEVAGHRVQGVDLVEDELLPAQ